MLSAVFAPAFFFSITALYVLPFLVFGLSKGILLIILVPVCIDFIYYGLNYQIEHHLFPDCPRNKLKRITPFIQEVCQKNQLPFTVTGAFESFKIILRELNKTAKTARVVR